MNRRGFTFIELLGVIVLLGIILIIAIPSITEALKISRIKSEEVFLDKLSDTIDSYITMHSDELVFSNSGNGKKSYQIGSETKTDIVTIYSVNNITAANLISDNLITANDFKDPAFGTKCETTTPIEIYRDSDYVYCHKVKASELNCLSDDYIEEKCTANEIANRKCYIIDTCIWEE